ncbi:hypothetical protein GLA29479_1356 [Lysobacter antibioticus]|nr:hypothetical protein GLA29479_1356 [Lysobacter antibioticus]
MGFARSVHPRSLRRRRRRFRDATGSLGCIARLRRRIAGKLNAARQACPRHRLPRVVYSLPGITRSRSWR